VAWVKTPGFGYRVQREKIIYSCSDFYHRMENTQRQEMLCKNILAGMHPVIRAYHTNRWTQNRDGKVLPPLDPEKVYAEWRRLNKPVH
jgi:hypothetical protein